MSLSIWSRFSLLFFLARDGIILGGEYLLTIYYLLFSIGFLEKGYGAVLCGFRVVCGLWFLFW